MRWRFFDSTNKSECRQREETLVRIDDWWKAFAAKTDSLSALFANKARWDLADWMELHLQAIHPSLMWEFGPGVKGSGHRLVITPESAHHLRPLVGAILERAPTLPGWEFYPYRLAENLEETQATVQGRTGSDIGEYQVRLCRGEFQRIDLCYAAPDVNGSDDQEALNAAFVATESLLGEELLDCWIGAVEVANLQDEADRRSASRPGTARPARFMPLERLRDNVQALIASMREQLPERPHFERMEGAEWTAWELTPGEDAEPFEQQDLLVARSVNPDLWMAAHSGFLFFSERFSRCGETFCYLKWDIRRGMGDARFKEKAELEDAVDEVLMPGRLGCTIGGGTGSRYSYTDLALVDVAGGIEAIRRRLREGNICKEAWIQFLDADLGAEWIGIYDDSPPPPIRFEE